MGFGGAAADEKSFRDFRTGFSFGGEFEHEQFAFGELRSLDTGDEALERGGNRFLAERFAEILAAAGSGADRLDEFGRRTIFQHVTTDTVL